nr:MAG TPA: hypothetical protein [Caudoviricetes sp.]
MSAADKTVVMTFLKNNGITAESSDEELAAMSDAWQQLKQDKKAKALGVLREAKEALKETDGEPSVKPKAEGQQSLQHLLS